MQTEVPLFSLTEFLFSFFFVSDVEMFSRFVNLLMNDAIFLWDESMTKLADIKQNQIDIERGLWATLDPNTRREREERYVFLCPFLCLFCLSAFSNSFPFFFVAMRVLSAKCVRSFCSRLSRFR